MLVTLQELLQEAEEMNKAVGSFTCANMEIAMGTIRAAQESNTPVIIQIAEGRLATTPLDYIGPMMVQAAKDASVKVCVHLDHGLTVQRVQESLEYGFTSVMYDGSGLPLEENIAKTNEIAEIARKSGASVEGELGVIGGKEATDREEEIIYTRVSDAVEYAGKTDIDALAVAIGNKHGHYKGIPHLNFERLEELHSAVKVPLVLHGGSGISGEDFRRCIDRGVRKINIATANLDALIAASKDYLSAEGEHNFYDWNAEVVQKVYENVKYLIRVFNNREAI